MTGNDGRTDQSEIDLIRYQQHGHTQDHKPTVQMTTLVCTDWPTAFRNEFNTTYSVLAQDVAWLRS